MIGNVKIRMRKCFAAFTFMGLAAVCLATGSVNATAKAEHIDKAVTKNTDEEILQNTVTQNADEEILQNKVTQNTATESLQNIGKSSDRKVLSPQGDAFFNPILVTGDVSKATVGTEPIKICQYADLAAIRDEEDKINYDYRYAVEEWIPLQNFSYAGELNYVYSYYLPQSKAFENAFIFDIKGDKIHISHYGYFENKNYAFRLQLGNQYLDLNIQLTSQGYKYNSYWVGKGKNLNLKLPGVEAGQKVMYSSSKKSVATISKDGKVKGKKQGYTVITAKVDDKVYKTVVNVTKNNNVGKMIKQTDYILKNWEYSMDRRGQKGYFDCSSLIWRVYNKYENITFGTSYYGNSDSEYAWMRNNCKKVAKNCKSKKIQAGDVAVLFKPNGGTWHVQMCSGYSMKAYPLEDGTMKFKVYKVWLFDLGDGPVYRPLSRK